MLEKTEKKRCIYVDVCYLAEGLQCYGFKLDCTLYRKSNDTPVTEEDFHRAINKLINKAKAAEQNIG